MHRGYRQWCREGELRELVLDNTLPSPAMCTVGQGGGDGVGDADALLYAGREFVRVFLVPAVEFDCGYGVNGILTALALVVAAPLVESHIVEDGAVRHERHILEHHADPFGVELANVIPGGEGTNILALYEQLARCWLDEAIDVAYKGGLV